jgi:hypothetical protein
MGLVRRAQGARRRRCQCTSLTTSNAEIARNPHAPFGFRRHTGASAASACWRSSTMYTDIACVAPPGICPRGARNAIPPNTRTDS